MSDIFGHVSDGFEPVRDAFAENFTRRHELGGACAAYLQGEKVVDLWGGVRDKASGEPWQEDTMVIVYSTTKGLAAMTLALAHSRGWLDYDERVATYWPEFAQNGKADITVRQLLAHQAGLFALDEPIGRDVVADPDRLAAILARQEPAWTPGTRQGYHAVTLGYYESEILRRIDPKHRTLGVFFEEEIARPLGLEFYIRLPEWIPSWRLAKMTRPGLLEMLRGFPPHFLLDVFNTHSNISRALRGSELADSPEQKDQVYSRNLEVPSGSGVGTARSIAKAYSVFATGGRELNLRAETLREIEKPADSLYDECMRTDGMRFSLGFLQASPLWPLGREGSFGAPGAGGSLGYADPKEGVGYGYITNRMGTSLTGDPRDVALRRALYAALEARKIRAAA